MTLQDWLQTADLLVNCIMTLGIILAFLSLLSTKRSLKMAAREHEVSIFSAVQDRWNRIYPVRNRLLNTDLTKTNWEDMTIASILNSQEWIDTVRPVANFYEFIGMLVYQGYVDADVAFVLVTVDEESYRRAQPVIGALRTKYRKDLYVFWDYLVRQSRSVAPLEPNAEHVPQPI